MIQYRIPAIAPRPLLIALGATLYTISFALPAVSVRAYDGSSVSGWDCARVTLIASISSRGLSLPFLASGLINPLAMAWLVLRLKGAQPRVRRVLAFAVLSLVPVTWYVMARDLSVRIGHVVWVAGLLLMLIPGEMGER